MSVNELEIKRRIIELLSKELKIDANQIKDDSTFYDLGLDSVNSIFLIYELEKEFHIDIDPLAIYDNPSLQLFTLYLKKLIHEAG